MKSCNTLRAGLEPRKHSINASFPPVYCGNTILITGIPTDVTELTKPTGQDCPKVAKPLGFKIRPKKTSECISKSYPGWKNVCFYTVLVA